MIERTSIFKYLSSMLDDKWDSDKEIKIKAAMTKAIIAKMDKYFI